MDMPQLSRIDARARVSPVTRSEDAQGEVSREFAALIVNEEAARHRSAAGQEAGDHRAEASSADPPIDAAESIIEPQPPDDTEQILPEDAHDPQELRAMLTVPNVEP